MTSPALTRTTSNCPAASSITTGLVCKLHRGNACCTVHATSALCFFPTALCDFTEPVPFRAEWHSTAVGTRALPYRNKYTERQNQRARPAFGRAGWRTRCPRRALRALRLTFSDSENPGIRPDFMPDLGTTRPGFGIRIWVRQPPRRMLPYLHAYAGALDRCSALTVVRTCTADMAL